MTTTFEDKNRAFFGRWAKKYDHLHTRLFFEPLYRHIITLIKQIRTTGPSPLHTPIKFLDVACGTGEILFRLAREFTNPQFVGLDLTPEMITKAKNKTNNLPNVSYREGSASSIPFADETFDIAVCSEAFHHFPEPAMTLREIYRVLKPGGIFLLADIAFNNFILKYLAATLLKPLEHAHAYYSRHELVELLKTSGLTIIQAKGYWWNNFIVGKK